MKIGIKSFGVKMEVKSSGIELEVRSPDGEQFLGDCFVTMTGLTWCKGKTGKERGQEIKWGDFIALMSAPEVLKEAVKKAKNPL